MPGNASAGASEFEVVGLLKKDGEPRDELPLAYAGHTSQFAGTWRVEQPGMYEAAMHAYQ